MYYTYNGITGTLYELCKIFNKDLNDVQQILEHCKGFLFETEALEKAPIKIKQHSLNIDYKMPDFSLTDDQRKMAEDYYHLFESFVNKRKVQDEDLKSDLYIYYLCIISKIQTNDSSKQYSAQIINSIKNAYITLCRKINSKNQIMELNNFIEINTIDNSETTIYQQQLKEVISSVLETLTKREAKIIRLRFGLKGGQPLTLEETGSFFNLGKERIRSIEAKALRKLRHPARSKKLHSFNEYDSNVFQNFINKPKEKCIYWYFRIDKKNKTYFLYVTKKEKDKDYIII